MKLTWNMCHDGVITIYLRDRSKTTDLADVYRSPLSKTYGGNEAAKRIQISIVEKICDLYNSDESWHCPIGVNTCKGNCGSYGCGN